MMGLCEVEGFCACRECLYGDFFFFLYVLFWNDRISRLHLPSTLSMFRGLKCAAKDVASHARSC